MSASQAIRSRANASRREPRPKSTPVNFGINTLGMNRVSSDQMNTLDQFFTSHPAIQAARTVLHSQLFSGGVALVRNGTMLKTLKGTPPDQPDKPASLSSASSAIGSATTEQNGIKEPFARHLNNHWCDFARDVVDNFLKFGLVVVTYELEPEDESVRAARLAQQEFGLSSKKRARDPTVQRRLVPRVPTLGTYEVGFEQSGRNAYTRSYQVYAQQAPQHALKVDEQSVVHVLNHPDSVGNINSPLASVWELGSFVRTITELALTAEVARAQPQIVTQLRKQDKTSALDPGSLFFDSASRNMQAGNDTEESEGAARALEMQAHLCKVINAMQTTHRPDQPFSQAFEPPDVPPKLFTLPKEHELAPNTNKPEPRGDLEALMRLSIDQVSAALGVPSSLIFEGRFSGKSTQQLQLLNSTVSQLAAAVNRVLSKTYSAIYPDLSDSDGVVELKLRTAPLAASEEVTALYTAGLIDIETAVPASMHALGSSSEEIDTTLSRLRAKDAKACACEDEDRELQKKEREAQLEKTKVEIKNTTERGESEPSKD